MKVSRSARSNERGDLPAVEVAEALRRPKSCYAVPEVFEWPWTLERLDARERDRDSSLHPHEVRVELLSGDGGIWAVVSPDSFQARRLHFDHASGSHERSGRRRRVQKHEHSVLCGGAHSTQLYGLGSVEQQPRIPRPEREQERALVRLHSASIADRADRTYVRL